MKHLLFIGRWSPLHKGHKHIMQKTYNEKQLPLLIAVRNTEETIPLETRVTIAERWLEQSKIPGQVIVIPDIAGIYYGRGVGYEVVEIDVDDVTKQVSGTEIRDALEKRDYQKVYDSVYDGDVLVTEDEVNEWLTKMGYPVE